MTPSTPERLVHGIASDVAVLNDSLSRALVNLRTALPGFPTSTLGAKPSSSPSSDPDDTVSGSITERIALGPPDEARQAQRDLERALLAANAATRLARGIVDRWGFQPAKGVPAAEEDVNDPWCLSCIRIELCTPRFRGVLCRWCYNIVIANPQFTMPPRDLLRAHHEGRRITQGMIDAAHPVKRGKK